MGSVANSLLLIYALLFEVKMAVAHGKHSIKINVDSVPYTLEPPKLTDTTANWVLYQVGDRLIDTYSSGIISADLAKTWTVSSDGLIYKFVIKSGVKFSDGSELTSKEIIWSLKEAKRLVKGGNWTFFTEAISEITADGKLGVTIKLKRKIDRFLDILAEPTFTVYKKCEKEFCFTGSFIVKNIEKKQLTLLRLIDNQEFDLIQMPFGEAFDRFKKNKLQILKSYGYNDSSKMKKENNRNIEMPYERFYFFALNSQSKIFSSEENRSSFKQAIASSKLSEFLSKFGLKYIPSLVSPNFNRLLSSDPPMLVNKSSGKFSKFRVLTLATQNSEDLIRFSLQNMDYEIFSLEKIEFINRLLAGDYDAIFLGYGVTMRQVDHLAIFFHSKSLHNFARIDSKIIDKEIMDSWSMQDFSSRIEKYKVLVTKNFSNNWYFPITYSPLVFSISNEIKADIIDKRKSFTIDTPTLDLNEVNWR